VTEVAAARPVAAVSPRSDDTGPVLLAAVPVTDVPVTDDAAALPVEAMWPAAEVAFAVAEDAAPPGALADRAEPTAADAEWVSDDVAAWADEVAAWAEETARPGADDRPAAADDEPPPDAPVAAVWVSGALGLVAAEAGLWVRSDAPMATAIPATAVAAAYRHSRRMWVTSPLVTKHNLVHPDPKV
jgi:hypothetical protein